MNVFVAGATGALGRHVVPQLLRQGHTVTAAGRSAESLKKLARVGATPAVVDILDGNVVLKAVAGHDAIINVATRVPSPSRMLLPLAWKDMDRIRTEGSSAIAAAAIAHGVTRLVQESFAPIYPDSGAGWITETTPPTPARYNRSVLNAERSASSVARAGGSAVILRFAMLYGPGDPFAEQVLGAVRKGWSPFLGSPDSYLSFVTHADAAAAAVAALEIPGGIYNVVDDEPLRRSALVTSIAEIIGAKSPRALPGWVAKLGGSLGETLARSLRISNRKLREASSWAPSVPDARRGFELALEAKDEQASSGNASAA